MHARCFLSNTESSQKKPYLMEYIDMRGRRLFRNDKQVLHQYKLEAGQYLDVQLYIISGGNLPAPDSKSLQLLAGPSHCSSFYSHPPQINIFPATYNDIFVPSLCFLHSLIINSFVSSSFPVR